MALHEHLTAQHCGQDLELTASILKLRGWALYLLNRLGDNFSSSHYLRRTDTHRPEQVLGDTHPDTMQSRSNLATAYWAAGRLDEAIALDERTLTDCEQTLGDTHPDTLTTRNNLATAYWAAGRLNEAIALLHRTLTDSRAHHRRHPPRHPDHPQQPRRRLPGRRATRRGHRAARAHPHRPRANPRRHPPRHPDLPQQPRRHLPGRRATRRGHPATRRTLTDREQTLGDTHPDTLTSRNNLAATYRAAGRLDEAIALHERTLTDREQTLGDTHPDTLISRNNLAAAYQAAGRLDEAKRLRDHHADS